MLKSKAYTESWQLEPEDEDGLEREVPGKIVKDNAQCKALEKVEEAKYNPVCEPLDVIVGRG